MFCVLCRSMKFRSLSVLVLVLRSSPVVGDAPLLISKPPSIPFNTATQPFCSLSLPSHGQYGISAFNGDRPLSTKAWISYTSIQSRLTDHYDVAVHSQSIIKRTIGPILHHGSIMF